MVSVMENEKAITHSYLAVSRKIYFLCDRVTVRVCCFNRQTFNLDKIFKIAVVLIKYFGSRLTSMIYRVLNIELEINCCACINQSESWKCH